MMSNGPLMLFTGFLILVILGVLCLAFFKEDNENPKTKTNH
jgi:hypothetical protein